MAKDLEAVDDNLGLININQTQGLVESGTIAYSYASLATSSRTRESYRSDIRHFISWGGVLPTTPDVVIRYLEHYAGLLNPSTLKRRLTAIKNWHTYQNFKDPTSHPVIQKTMSGIARVHGKPARKARALTLDQLQEFAQRLEKRGRPVDIRNCAMLYIGFFGAFRRSELVAINWEHITFVEKGVEILVPRSKIDQEGRGEICGIPYVAFGMCPVRALKEWQKLCNQQTGPVFVRTTKSGLITQQRLNSSIVTTVVSNMAKECDLQHAEEYTAHSLRRGFATSASQKGASFAAIMRHGRWRGERTVFEYIADGERFTENAVDTMMKNFESAPPDV